MATFVKWQRNPGISNRMDMLNNGWHWLFQFYFPGYLQSDMYYKYLSDLVSTVQTAQDIPVRPKHRRTGELQGRNKEEVFVFLHFWKVRDWRASLYLEGNGQILSLVTHAYFQNLAKHFVKILSRLCMMWQTDDAHAPSSIASWFLQCIVQGSLQLRGALNEYWLNHWHMLRTWWLEL